MPKRSAEEPRKAKAKAKVLTANGKKEPDAEVLLAALDRYSLDARSASNSQNQKGTSASRAAGPSCMLAGAQSMPRQVQQAEGKKAAERQPRSQHPETQTMPRGVEQNDQPPDDTRRQLSQFQAALARLDDLACTKQERAMPEL
ncbi:unnamed protein product [Effrenium voratum]|nr:unnamed protein product [Effrenium voratum]